MQGYDSRRPHNRLIWRHIEEEINKLEKDKDESVAIQDFERAARLRDKADKLKKKKETIEKEMAGNPCRG